MRKKPFIHKKITSFKETAFADNKDRGGYMKNDPIWRAFSQTGDPVYYLLYKAAAQSEKKKAAQNIDRTGDTRPQVRG